MIKFFRSIRRSLLMENKTSRYFKYAIGEIILVVIGILIALQINTWNNHNISHQKEQQYLQNLERDLKLQIEAIDRQMSYELQTYKTTKPLIVYYKKHHRFLVDSSFTSSIGKLTGRKTFVNHNATYTELLASGTTDILTNGIFKNQLIQYYQQLDRMQQIINKNNNLFTDAVFVPEIMKLSELQMSSIYIDDALGLNMTPADYSLNGEVDLNEEQLKATTRMLLQNPEKELIFVNAINFKHHLSKIHQNFLQSQKEETLALIELLHHYD